MRGIKREREDDGSSNPQKKVNSEKWSCRVFHRESGSNQEYSDLRVPKTHKFFQLLEYVARHHRKEPKCIWRLGVMVKLNKKIAKISLSDTVLNNFNRLKSGWTPIGIRKVQVRIIWKPTVICQAGTAGNVRVKRREFKWAASFEDVVEDAKHAFAAKVTDWACAVQLLNGVSDPISEIHITRKEYSKCMLSIFKELLSDIDDHSEITEFQIKLFGFVPGGGGGCIYGQTEH